MGKDYTGNKNTKNIYFLRQTQKQSDEETAADDGIEEVELDHTENRHTKKLIFQGQTQKQNLERPASENEPGDDYGNEGLKKDEAENENTENPLFAIKQKLGGYLKNSNIIRRNQS